MTLLLREINYIAGKFAIFIFDVLTALAGRLLVYSFLIEISTSDNFHKIYDKIKCYYPNKEL